MALEAFVLQDVSAAKQKSDLIEYSLYLVNRTNELVLKGDCTGTEQPWCRDRGGGVHLH